MFVVQIVDVDCGWPEVRVVSERISDIDAHQMILAGPVVLPCGSVEAGEDGFTQLGSGQSLSWTSIVEKQASELSLYLLRKNR